MSLLEELAAAEVDPLVRAAKGDRLCPVCSVIGATEDEAERDLLIRCAAGRIGRDKFTAIMQRGGFPDVTRRAVERHRREDHRP